MKRTWRSGIFGVYKFYRENVKNCRTVPEKCTTGSGVRINSTKIPSKFLRKNTKSRGKTRKLHIFENCYCEFEVLGSLHCNIPVSFTCLCEMSRCYFGNAPLVELVRRLQGTLVLLHFWTTVVRIRATEPATTS